MRLLIITSALALALHAQVPVARSGDCDEGINADLFQDFGKEKDEKKPKHRLIKAPCDGCQWFLDALQKALDDCNNKKFKDAKDKKATVTGSNTTGSAMQDGWIAVQANAQMDEASDALKGEPKDPPKGRSPKDLKDEVDKKWKELRDRLASCRPGGSWLQQRRLATGGGVQPQPGGAQPAPQPAASTPTPTPTPTPKPSRPRTYTGPAQSPTPTPQEHGMAPRRPGKTSETCAVLIATGKIKIDTVGTGETIGHIADLKIQNLTDQPIKCAVPPMILESGSRKNQHYACPTGQTVALNPHQTKTVPMNGVCLNRNKPPVAKGVSGDLVINEANPSGSQNPNSHLPATDAGKLLRSCAAKYTAADQLQKSGALKNLPYHDPQKQKDIVVQWSTWTDPEISQMTGSPPATKEDLRKVVYKQVTGPMTPEKKKKVDQGIDTIFEKVELTSAKAKDLEKTPFSQVELTGEEAKGVSPAPSASPAEGEEKP